MVYHENEPLLKGKVRQSTVHKIGGLIHKDDAQGFTSSEKFKIGGLAFCALTNFIFFKACSNANGTYDFKLSNLTLVTSIVMASLSYTRSHDPFGKDFCWSLFFWIFVTALANASGIVLGPLGVAKTNVSIASALFFLQQPFVFLISAVYDYQWHPLTPTIVIASAAIQIFFFTCYSLKGGNTSLVGMIILMGNAFVCAVSSTVNSKIVAHNLEVHQTDKTFWFWIASITVSFALIPIESLVVYGKLSAYDMVPGAGFGLSTFGLVAFEGIFVYYINEVSMLDVNIYITTYFASTVLSSLCASMLVGFKGFDIIPFCMAVSIGLNAFVYQLAYESHEKEHQVEEMLETLRNVNGAEWTRIMEIAEETRENKAILQCAHARESLLGGECEALLKII